MNSKSGKQENNVDLIFFITLMMLISFDLASAYEISVAAEAPSTWINNDRNFSASFKYLMPILLSNQTYASQSIPRYLCGFYCVDDDVESNSYPCKRYLFSVVIAYQYESGQLGDFRTVWSANRGNPVKANATLQLTSKDGLVLKDADDKVVWSTGIPNGKLVATLKMGESGNLVLLDVKGFIVWQTFDYPTDTLVLGQSFVTGQKLTSTFSDASEANHNATQFHYSMSLSEYTITFSFESNPPQVYFTQFGRIESIIIEPLGILYNITVFQAESAQSRRSLFLFLQLRADGHLMLYEHQKLDTEDRGHWEEVTDLLGLGGCPYPTACGRYGICTAGKQCSCPTSVDHKSTNYFLPISNYQLDQGCAPITPLTCSASQFHTFVIVENVSYYNYVKSDIGYIETALCKNMCLRNCSCKAAIVGDIFNMSNSSKGYCYLLYDVFSLEKGNMTIDVDKYPGTAFIKVQNNPRSSRTGDNKTLLIIFGVRLGAGALFIVSVAAIYLFKKSKHDLGNEEDHLDHILGMLSRFSYEELTFATANFTMKLGQGGFGSVFEGVLKDGSKIAVKCLDQVGQVNKSFLAEVESIGNIHHVNLVRLIGFCADKSRKLLVYEYMVNGSLDSWIYGNSQNVIFDWSSRRKIIQDVAKGLEYLHEGCRQIILHLDVKPQNILLDENFHAKLSDFGLAKLIDRDQSKVVTTMRGTPGYLAPEWLSGGVTEKVDVYSFGIVLLEILCGRKHFKVSEPEEARHLLSLFKAKAEEEKLVDLVDNRSEDMLSHSGEVIEMMRVAAWCLASDSRRRPSMSMVSKVLDGIISVEGMLDYNNVNATYQEMDCQLRDCTPLILSSLTLPR